MVASFLPLASITIALIALFELIGMFFFLYCFYFKWRIRSYTQLNGFNKPWAVRVGLIVLSMVWGIFEFLRQEIVLHALSLSLQRNICQIYEISNLGIIEPFILLIILSLLRLALQEMERGILLKTVGLVLLLDTFVLIPQFMIVLFGTAFNKDNRLALYFIEASHLRPSGVFCVYPLATTVVLAIFEVFLLSKLSSIGKNIVDRAINIKTKRRILFLVTCIPCCCAARLIFLGFSIISRPDHLLFQGLVFLGFLAMVFSIAVSVYTLAFFPYADSLASIPLP